MSVYGVAMVRDEADVVGSVLTRMLRQLDHVIVADNRSIDGTSEIVRSFERVTVLDDPDPEFAQARKMTALARLAIARGASWVVPFDADEVWVARDGRRVADALAELPEDVLLAPAAILDHVSTAHDPAASDPVDRMVYRRREPALLPKLACRGRPGLALGKGNHAAGWRDVPEPRPELGLLAVHHFCVRSEEQFVRKTRIAAEGLASTYTPPHASIHRREWAQVLDTEGEAGLVQRFRADYWSDDPSRDGLVLDPCP